MPFNAEIKAKSLQLKIAVDIDELFVDFEVYKNIFYLVIKNAIMYNKPGKDLLITVKSSENSRLTTVVKDFGEGITHVKLAQILNAIHYGGSQAPSIQRA